MPGTILIVDAVAINRIVLKVKLTAAFYTVHQATTRDEAMQLLAAVPCNLVILGEGFDLAAACDLLWALSALPSGTAPPAVVLSSDDATDFRRGVLRAGAADVLARPVADAVLLARMRNLIRRADPDMARDLGPAASDAAGPDGFAPDHLAAGTHGPGAPAPATGCAEAAAPFAPPGRLALVSAMDRRDGGTLRRLRDGLRGNAVLCTPAQVLAGAAEGWDVMVLDLPPDAGMAQLALISDLRARAATRDAGIIVIAPADRPELAATAFDLGASDVISDCADTGELQIRVDVLVRQKRRADGMRNRLRDRLRASVTDPLTGLYNRRHAVPFLTERLGRLGRMPKAATGCAVMLIDVDFFKSVNDLHGHAGGDIALVEVAQRLARAVPPEALVARTGGEEFLVILPDTTEGTALALAEELRQAVRARPVALETATVGLTVSIGVVLARSGDGDLRADKVIDRADRAMYAAKARGRDRVCNARATPAVKGARPVLGWDRPPGQGQEPLRRVPSSVSRGA